MANKNKKGTTLYGLANKIDKVSENLNELAIITAKGFESTATKIELREVERNLEQKIAKVDSRVDDIYEILTRFEEGDILDLQNRIKILERTVKAIGRRLV